MQLIRVEHVEDAVPDIVKELNTSGATPRLVRIEGVDGAGKTTLADALGEKLSGSVLHGDDFITRKNTGEPYSHIIDCHALQSRILHGLASGGWVIVEAVCLNEITPEELVGRGFRIYVKRLSFNNPTMPFWHGFDAEGDVPKREIRRSIHLYHLKHKPHERADMMIEVPELGHTLHGPRLG